VTADRLDPLLELPGVRAAVLEARNGVDALLGHRLLRRRSAEVSAEAGLRSARASAALEGVDVGLDQIRAGTSDPLLTGALRVATGLGSMVDTIDRAPLQALARLHSLAARGLVSDELLGRPRLGEGIGPRLAALAELIAGRRTGPALLISAVVHGELLALQAFTPACGVVARGAARLLLVARGLDPKALTAPDVGHLERSAEYAQTALGYAQGDPGPWLVHCAEAARLGAVESVAICEALQRTAEAEA
jgi:hypothetical protein